MQWRIATDRHFLVGLTSLGAGMLLLAPKGLGVRAFALLLLAAVIWAEPPEGPLLEVAVLDVGQGLSVVVSSRDKVLVYDVGSKFSDRFNIGSAVLAPYLRYRGVSGIDTLVVSHGDNDHAGGLQGLLETVAVDRVLAGQALHLPIKDVQPCEAGVTWRWQELEFTVLHPSGFEAGRPVNQSDNNQSCVLSITMGDQTILLTGDIEADVEQVLLQKGILPSDVTLLLAPHHGSKTSSSEGFVRWVNPDHVVYSAGY
ncbi:MAG TPA: DNA internalization-related competence protein ComEC/Rec2, partial [Porticoccaceae bacterium]|nr:DNA internalization-related competence protein ComEC/Rec2 [Porticoccaceae bacterium]